MDKVFQIVFLIIMSVGVLGLPLYYFLNSRRQRIIAEFDEEPTPSPDSDKDEYDPDGYEPEDDFDVNNPDESLSDSDETGTVKSVADYDADEVLPVDHEVEYASNRGEGYENSENFDFVQKFDDNADDTAVDGIDSVINNATGDIEYDIPNGIDEDDVIDVSDIKIIDEGSLDSDEDVSSKTSNDGSDDESTIFEENDD